tara:strand:- start:3545 stop:4501 length:957 start_codon:yes stop_codon:yes gene_type:complete
MAKNGSDAEGLTPAGQGAEGLMDVESDRAIEEVRAALVIARRFPRDMTVVTTRIMTECRRKGLAEVAIYTYPRGSTKVEGPSIRLAEAMARSFGNMQYGIEEVAQRAGESDVKAFAWDLEMNVKAERTFKVRHIRETKKGDKALTSPRDIYELVANQGARRLRACIMELIPGDIIEDALKTCRKTLTEGNDKPLADRINAMAAAFATEYGVSVDQLEMHLGHTLASTSETELVTLKGVFRSLKESMGTVADFFDDDVIAMPTTDKDAPEGSEAEAPKEDIPPEVDPDTGEVIPPLNELDLGEKAQDPPPADPKKKGGK